MEPVGHVPSPGLRQLNLKKSFKLGIRSLLTTCSKEEFLNAFPTFSKAKQEALYLMFIQVITSVHQNIEEEFESICDDTQVSTVLDTVEQLMEEKSLDILSNDMTDLVDAKQQISKAKQDEMAYLTTMLEKVEEQNQNMKAQIDSLEKERLDSLGTGDTLEKLRSWNSTHGQLAKQ